MATTTATSTTASTTPTATPGMRAALVSLPPCSPVVPTIDVVVTGNELVTVDSPISDDVSLTTAPDIVTTVVVITIMVVVSGACKDAKLPKEEPALLTELVASNGCGLVLKLGFWLVEEEEVEESSGGSDTVLGQHSTTGRKRNYMH